MIRLLFGLISGTAGVTITVVDLGFAIWAGIGKPWYIYLLNFVILFTASSVINSSYIQGLTRGVSFIYLYGLKGASKAFLINIPTAIFIFIAYFITRFVFSISIQYAMFLGICIVLSTIVAFVDNHFQIAIDRTRAFESMTKGVSRMTGKEINRAKEEVRKREGPAGVKRAGRIIKCVKKIHRELAQFPDEESSFSGFCRTISVLLMPLPKELKIEVLKFAMKTIEEQDRIRKE